MSAVSESAGYRIGPIGRSASVHISILLSACLRIEIETQSEVIFISGISRHQQAGSCLGRYYSHAWSLLRTWGSTDLASQHHSSIGTMPMQCRGRGLHLDTSMLNKEPNLNYISFQEFQWCRIALTDDEGVKMRKLLTSFREFYCPRSLISPDLDLHHKDNRIGHEILTLTFSFNYV